MNNLLWLGKLGCKELLERTFGKIMTDDVVATTERMEHIKENHPQDYDLFGKYNTEILNSPDLIIKDTKNYGTIFMVKRMENSNMNVVLRLVLETDAHSLKNSVITFYRLRNSNLSKLTKKHEVLYKQE